MSKNIRLIFFMLSGCFFVGLDQVLKYLARTNPDFYFTVFSRHLGWEYFPNPGVAFGLPIPNLAMVFVTPLLLLILFLFLRKKQTRFSRATFAGVLIFFGALSNYIDRVIFGVTIDYLRIVTGVINLADIMIVAGVLLLLLEEKHRRNN